MDWTKCVFFLLLLLGLSSAATDFTAIVPVTAVIVAILLAIMSMLATALSLPSLQAWVKTELRELIAGVLLVVIIYGLFIGAKDLTAAITGTGDYINYSEQIIIDIITNDSHGYDRAYTDIIRAGSKIRIASSYAPYVVIPIPYVSVMYSDAPLAGAGVLINPLMAATQGLSNNILLFEAVLLLIKVSAVAVPAVLLPIGFALRIIPFTRATGNTVIAVSIAAIVFLPFSVIIIDQMHKAITYPAARLSSSNLTDLDFMADYGGQAGLVMGQILCGSKVIRTVLSLNEFGFSFLTCFPLLVYPPAFLGCWNNMIGWLYEKIISVMQWVNVGVTGGSLAVIYIESAAGEGYASRAYDVLYPFLKQVNNLIVLGYLDIALMGIITVTGARSVSAVLGGEWYLAGIQRLV